MTTNIRCLHGKTVAVHVDVSGSQILLKGVGAAYQDPTLGSCVRIVVKDADGNFELILRQSQWKGEIHSGADFKCDYQISLDNRCPSQVEPV